MLPKLFCGANLAFWRDQLFRPSVPGATPVSSFLISNLDLKLKKLNWYDSGLAILSNVSLVGNHVSNLGATQTGWPAYVLDMSSGNLPLPNGIPSTWHFWAKGSSTGFGVVFPSKIFGQTSSHPCSVKISEKQTSKQTSKLWDFNLWYLKNISYIKTHGTLELQTPSPPGQGSLEAAASVVSSWTRSAQPTPRRSGDGPAQLANLGLVLTVGDYLSIRIMI